MDKESTPSFCLAHERWVSLGGGDVSRGNIGIPEKGRGEEKPRCNRKRKGSPAEAQRGVHRQLFAGRVRHVLLGAFGGEAGVSFKTSCRFSPSEAKRPESLFFVLPLLGHF